MANEPQNKPDLSNTDAVDFIRSKVGDIYNEMPDAVIEAAEAENTKSPSKHQKYMLRLMDSGRDIAWAQTEWHKYYQSLNEQEKLEAWEEFYKSNKNITKPGDTTSAPTKSMSEVRNQLPASRHYQPRKRSLKPKPLRPVKAVEQPKVQIHLKTKHHLQSILFGLGIGSLAIIIFLFGFFNEVIIAPFIQPARNSSVPVIIGTGAISPTSTPEVIVPKINVEIPVAYNVGTTNENVIENDLEGGVIHFPTTVLPGQIGNAAFFGHSSNNIFNPGKYKFAFVLLHTLVDGDTFYLTYNHTVYVYKVINHFIVSPSDVAVLGPVSGQTATATLITCDPPGTSINRLIVIGQQISPTVGSDTQAPTTTVITTPKSLPGNGPTLWSRFISSDEGKVIVVMVALVAVIIIFRRTSKKEIY